MATILNSNLFPPIIDTFFSFSLKKYEYCKIYLQFPKTLTEQDIHMNLVHLTIREQNTNKNVLNENVYPQEIKLTKLEKEDDLYFVKLYKSDLQVGNKFNLNTYYKIQLRFSSADTPLPESYDTVANGYFPFEEGEEAPQFSPSHSWFIDNKEKFSEWSSVCLVRRISSPSLEFVSSDSQYLTSSSLIGQLVFEEEDETDNLKSYQIKVTDNLNETNLYEDSGIIFISLGKNEREINYNFLYNFIANKVYRIKISATTTSNYSWEEDIYLKLPELKLETEIFINEFSVFTNEEEGYFQISLNLSSLNEDIETVILKRSSVQDDFSYWQSFKEFNFSNGALETVWRDYYIEYGVWYKYALQLKYKDNTYSDFFIPEENEDDIYLNFFEHIFLTNATQQLKIKFNPQVSSFKSSVAETKNDTIGSKYPFIRRNGNMDYKQFSLSGLISYHSDEENNFIPKESLYYNKTGQTLYESAAIDKNYKNTIQEKIFKEAVYKFLYDGKIKMFRSPTEGNCLVKLMDISLTPEATLGRMIYSFSCTAYEIDDISLENLKKYQILGDKEYTDIKKEYLKITSHRKTSTFPKTVFALDTVVTQSISNLEIVDPNYFEGLEVETSD